MTLVWMLLTEFLPVVVAVSHTGGARTYAEAIFRQGPPAHPTMESLVLNGSGVAAFDVDIDAGTVPFSHFFETSVGSGHISLSSRADYREHLAMAARDCGFKYVRGHGLLDDDMDVSKGPGMQSFYNIDSFVDFLLGIGMRPILELSFMPTWLANGTSTVCHYKGNNNPPTDYALWQELIQALAQHLVDRHGVDVVAEFYWEVWNEPNAGFWKGSQAEYFKLYQHAAWGIKNVSTKLRVGGPAACCSNSKCWLTDFVNFCDETGTPFDFVSSHDYSSGATDGYEVGSVSKVVSNFRDGRQSLGASIPWLITEYGASFIQGVGDHYAIGNAYHDMVDQASYTIAVVNQMANSPGSLREPQALSYWAFSDVFEEVFFPVHNESFHGMFGLINLHGVPKPTYRAYQLLHETGDERFNAVHQTSASGFCVNTTGVLAVKNGTAVDVEGKHRTL